MCYPSVFGRVTGGGGGGGGAGYPTKYGIFSPNFSSDRIEQALKKPEEKMSSENRKMNQNMLNF